MTLPFGKCVWCKRTDFTEEHILGLQFAKAIGISYPIPAYLGQFELPERTGIVLSDRVCDTCNKNWMRKLDNKAMKCVGPAVRAATRIQLKQGEQRVVAMWATKVALLLALRQADLVIKYPELVAEGDNAWVPDDSFAAIEKDKRRPPKGTKVWIGTLRPGLGLANFIERVGSFAVHRVQSGNDLALPVKCGYFVLFVLGHFVVYVSGWTQGHPPNPPDFTRRLRRSALTRIWPIDVRVAEWPTSETLVKSDLDNLTGNPGYLPRPPERRSRPVRPPEAPRS